MDPNLYTLLCVCVVVRREPVSTPPPAPSKLVLSPEELEKKSTAIIEEYLHINDMKVHTHTHKMLYEGKTVNTCQL